MSGSSETKAVYAITPAAARGRASRGRASERARLSRAQGSAGPPSGLYTQRPGAEINGNRSCSACGARSHNHVNCRFRDYVCSKCQRTFATHICGHLRRVCPEWGSAPSPRGPQRAGGQPAAGPRRDFYYGDADHERGECGGDIEDDLHHLCLNNYKAVS